jgi:hypothetical protein
MPPSLTCNDGGMMNNLEYAIRLRQWCQRKKAVSNAEFFSRIAVTSHPLTWVLPLVWQQVWLPLRPMDQS